jgi:hypothetical protein
MGASSRRRRPPGKTVEERENELISLAADLAEKQLAAGTASAQVITHFLKLGTMKAKLEMEKIKHENDLLQAKTDSIESAARIEELYKEAILAMRRYQGDEVEESEIENDV